MSKPIQRPSHAILLILLSLLQFAKIDCRFEMNMTANKKYAYKGKYNVITNQLMPIINTTSLVFSIPLPQTLRSKDVVITTIVDDLKVNRIYLDGISFRLSLKDCNHSHLAIELQTRTPKNLQYFQISYLIIRKDVIPFDNFILYNFNLTIERNVSSQQPFQISLTFPQTVNKSGSIQLFHAIAGIDALSLDNKGTIDIKNLISLASDSQINLTISSLTTTTYIKQMAYVVLIYNEGSLSNSKRLNFYNGFLQAEDDMENIGMTSFASKLIEMVEFNTLIGLTSFRISNQDEFQISNIIRDPFQNHGFQLVFVAESKISYVAVSFLVVYTSYCDYLYPYLYQSQQACYSSCPDETEQDEVNLSCLLENSAKDEEISVDAQSSSYLFLMMLILLGLALIIISKAVLKKFSKSQQKMIEQSMGEILTPPRESQGTAQLTNQSLLEKPQKGNSKQIELDSSSIVYQSQKNDQSID